MPQGLLHTPTESMFARRQPSMMRFFSEPRRSFIFIIAICLSIYFILVIIDNQYAQNVNDADIQEKIDYKSSIIEKQCSSVTNTCYTITDIKRELHNGREIVERNMIVDGFDDDSDTVVLLIPPKDSTFATSDTRMWKVDHFSVQAQYVAALIAAPFIVSTLSLVDRDNNGKQILEIGLGGGSFDMFLHEWNPKINITAVELDPLVVELSRRWFDVIEDSTRRTIVADGLKFIDSAVEHRHIYDVVILDACDSSKLMPCPATLFRETAILRKLSKIIAANGVLVVNILSYEHDELVEVNRLIETLTEIFSSCIRVTLKEEVNTIAICTHHSISDSQADFDFLKKRASAVTMRLGLQNILQSISIG